MKKSKLLKSKDIWLEDVEFHDYAAAQDYLELVMTKEEATGYVTKLKKASVIHKKAKDIVRASGFELAPKTNIHVKENIDKVKKGKKMSPVLLVVKEGLLIVADGFHRVSASYVLTEDLSIPCKLVC
jgi:hypothetical protein